VGFWVFSEVVHFLCEEYRLKVRLIKGQYLTVLFQLVFVRQQVPFHEDVSVASQLGPRWILIIECSMQIVDVFYVLIELLENILISR